MKCFVELALQCFGDIVVGQVARNISQCRPKLLRDKLQEPLPKVELSSTFRATCLATILAVAGYVTLKFFVQLVPPQCRQNIARQVARNISQRNSALKIAISYGPASAKSILIRFRFVGNVVNDWTTRGRAARV